MISDSRDIKTANKAAANLSLVLVADRNQQVTDIQSRLSEKGYEVTVIPADAIDLIDKIITRNPDAILLITKTVRDLAQELKQETSPPVIALLPRNMASGLALDKSLDDFILEPYNIDELQLRLSRLVHIQTEEENEVLTAGDLTVDSAKGKVTVAGNEVILTFKEYELLKFFMVNRGRVFTREALLDKVWGYNYFGGDRTVDVHVRRLRSKIEDAKHTFIDTVRSIGYRFRENL